jgi:hypothetical protein
MDIRRNEQSYLAKAKCIILVLLDLAVPKRFTQEYAAMTNVERDVVFKKALLDFFRYFYYRDVCEHNVTELEKRRIGEKSYLTLYDHLKDYATEHEVVDELNLIN